MTDSFPPMRGLMPAPFTPMTADGALNLRAVERQAEHFIDNRLRGVFVGGSSGEGVSLSVGERQELAQRWVEVARGTSLCVVVHVGHLALPDAKALARHAGTIGADAIASIAPFYFRPETVEDLLAYLREVAAEAPGAPFYYYDLPAFSRVTLSTVEVLERGRQFVPSLAGVKYTNPDQVQEQRLIALEDGRFDILHGTDETLLAGWSYGARGAVGSTYNMIPGVYQELIAAFEAGDLEAAARQQRRSVAFIDALVGRSYLAAAKATMTLLGVDVGPPRAPIPPLSGRAVGALRDDLERLGFALPG